MSEIQFDVYEYYCDHLLLVSKEFSRLPFASPTKCENINIGKFEIRIEVVKNVNAKQ